ncbi:MAG: M56 family metallopeptidase [Gemmatimonadetes bacterium]|nr:M56 family metallopeptidase [Gemmatimonadota bacterium]MYG22544.1 M56 family metallopeptidase [Gemmatimonadota bacterium]MYJ38923.1 M56 family metallopeptidase [Gemmatimonadota bacterium]
MNTGGATLLGLAPATVTLTAQVTCLLLLALALAWLGRRGSPGILHLLWTTTFVLVLVLPILGHIGPSWNVPLLPAFAGEFEAASGSARRELLLEDMGPVPPPETADMRRALVLAERARLDGRSVEAAGVSANATAWHAVVRIAWIAWIIGCGLSLILLAVSALRLRGLVRTARPVRDPDWVRQSEELRHRLGVRTKVRILSNAAVEMPMTGGLRRPVILLPESAASWSRERRAVVLSHELIHVRRRDALRRLMRRTMLALYWFHPLAWIASRQAALASEKACDEEVLSLGTRPSEYARHLLFLASGLTRGGPRALALPIVQASQLERRIKSILARRRPHASLLRTALTLLVIGAAGVSVAFVRPVPTVASAEIPGEASRETAAKAAIVAETAAESRRDQTATQAVLRGIECIPSSKDSIRSFYLRGDGRTVPNWKWTDGGVTIARPVGDRLLCMRAEGDVTLNADGAAVQALGEDSWLVFESQGEKTHRLAVTRTPDGVERIWSVDGIYQPFDAEARQWRDLMFTVMHGYLEAWLSYSGAMILYGRISGYRNDLSKLRSAMRDGERDGARRLVQDLAGWEVGLRQITETIRWSGLDDKTEAVARQLAEYDLSAAGHQTETEASELDDRLRGAAEQIQSEIKTLGLDLRLAEAERSLQGIIAELREVTR